MSPSLPVRSVMLAVFLFHSAAALAVTASPQTAVSGDSPPQTAFSPANELGQYRYLIEFSEPGLLRRQAGRAPGQRFDINAPGMRAARQQLQARQAAHRQTMESAVGRTLEITHYYLVSHSGMALWLTAGEAESIARLDEVVSVERERVYELDTYRGPEFIGAGAIWDGSAVPDESELRGEDMVIAVIDTGVDPAHPSFANDPACGHGDGGTPNKLLSFVDCHSTDGGGVCNGGTPQDQNGHGSHTASTAGGNALDGSAVPAPPIDITGVAPCAHVRSYRACGPGSGCDGAALAAALNNVLESDADVLNYSISGGASPWSDGDRIKLDLVDAGIFVAASAGNTSPEIPEPVGQVNHRGPWVLSVAASTHDGMFANPLSLDGGPSGVPAVEGTGPDLMADFTGSLRWAGDAAPGNERGCSAFPGGAFTGQAALIERGDCNFSDKVGNAVAAGATFVVVYNNVGGPPIIMGGLEGTAVSSFMVTDAAGADMIGTLNGATADVTVLVDGAFSFDPGLGDVLAGFSFRGPTPAPLQHLQKPDITGPGVQILAAVPGGYEFIGGTSMSSPHLAGSAALVRQAHPGWTVSEVKSAIQMTASKSGLKDDGSAPWDWDDVGSGRVDLTGAALAGLVMDETTANYLAANPATGGDVRTLNLAAVRDVECFENCSWTRTLRNTLEVPGSWELSANAISGGNFDIAVSPATLSFSGDTAETEDITITVTPNEDLTDTVYFGEVVLSETGGNSPDLHITVAFMGAETEPLPEIGVDPASLSSTLPQNQSETQTLTISNSGDADLNWGIVDSGDGEAWSDDFDGYANGSQMHGQGGWKGWFNDPAAGALVTDAEASSAPHSVEIVGASDLVREFTDINTGRWVLTAQQYIPGDFSGETFFILLNTYNDGGSGLNWSSEVHFDSATDTVFNQGASGGSMPLIRDQWVELRVEIDLSANTQAFYYNGGLLYTGTWTEEQSGSGALNLGAIDLFANGASEVYYDDISLVDNTPAQCDTPSGVPWLNAAPPAGTAPPAGESDVDVTFDPAGMPVGDYEATLCIVSNDAANDLVEVPVSLEVTEAVDLPVADIAPDSFEFVVPVGGGGSDVLTIGNSGEADLIWEIETAEPAGGGVVTVWRGAGDIPVTSDFVSGGGASVSETGDLILLGDLQMSQTMDTNIVPANSAACPTGPNHMMRRFYFDEHPGVGNPAEIHSVDIAIQEGVASQTLTVNLYTLANNTPADTIPLGSLVKIGSGSVTISPADDGSIVNVSVNAVVADTTVDDLVVETMVDDQFFIGATDTGETHPGFILAPACGAATPTRIDSLGPDFEDTHIIMVVNASEGAPAACDNPADIPWLSVDPDSGTTPPAGENLVDVTVDAAGLDEGEYEALLCVTTNDPNASLVQVPVSLTVTDEQEPGELAVDPGALDFGEVAVGAVSTMSFEVSNAAAAGASNLTLTAITAGGDAEFSVSGGDCTVGSVLEPGGNCAVEVSFAPGAETAFSGGVTVEGGGQTQAVTLSGSGGEPGDDIFSDRFEEE